jgi:hypothetical protein
MAEFFSSAPRFPENPDPMIMIGIGPPDAAETPPYAGWKMSDALDQVKHNGQVETRLGHQWIVFLYELWENSYRPRLAAAHARDAGDEKYDLLGDLRRMRNDVVHHQGVATADNTGRCVLLPHWFKAGEAIRLEGRHFDEFVRMIPWADLASGVNTHGELDSLPVSPYSPDRRQQCMNVASRVVHTHTEPLSYLKRTQERERSGRSPERSAEYAQPKRARHALKASWAQCGGGCGLLSIGLPDRVDAGHGSGGPVQLGASPRQHRLTSE